MTPDQKEIVNGMKYALPGRVDILLSMDAEYPLNEQVYFQKQIGEITYVYFHVLGNYVTGEMLRQGCSEKHIKKKMLEFGE